MNEIKKLGDIPDMERYLANDCYCPGEIYDRTGFFYKVFDADDECELIAEGDEKVAVTSGDQAIIFWREGGRIVDACRVDATDNNVGILRSIVAGEEPDGRKLDEFEPGSTKKSLEEVMGIADAVMVS